MSAGMTAERLIRRDRRILLLALGALLALSWALLVRQHAPGGASHPHLLTPHALEPGGLILAFFLWLIMMVAMMLPPVLPWILFFATTARRNARRHRPWLVTAVFVAGYFTVWAGFCLVAAILQLGLQHGALLHGAELKVAPVAGAVLLAIAGIYQFSPLKAACLKHCRSPLSYFLAYWKDGPAGAFGMGLRHGAYCLGCCWALMALSFALGIMNLLWMAVLTVLLCIEKIVPGGEVFSRLFGAGFLVWGLWLLVSA